MTVTFKQFRIFILLCILAYVAADQYIAEQRAGSWIDTLDVIIYPINGDASPQSQKMIQSLAVENFSSINQFLKQEAKHYNIHIDQPIKIHLAPPINKKPPPLPDINSGMLNVMWWSLKMRWWAWYENTYKGRKDIRLFIEYYADEATDSHISVGLQKGLLSLIKNYAGSDYIERNNVIIAHEMLHTLGATDKYDPDTLIPLFPDGYADPSLGIYQQQKQAEIMGGRIVLSEDVAIVPESLRFCLIGEKTAKEIGWIK